VSAELARARHDRVDADVAAVEIDVRDRWDALALSEALIPFHSFLVQRSAEWWVVHARAPGCHGEQVADALAAIDQWREERGTEASVRVDGRPQEQRR
jgi:hypothetical protein